MGIFSSLFGNTKKEAISSFKKREALVIDVRNPNEFKARHAEGSINIPLPLLKNEVTRLKKLNKPLIVCCASGVRSASAKKMLQKEGLEVINAGSWRAL